MSLTDRQAADLRKEDAVGEAYRIFNQHKQSNSHQPGLGFRNGLHQAVRELRTALIAIYAEVDGADELPLRDELATLISDRISAFIQSCIAGEHSANAAAAQAGAQLIATASMGVGRDLELAVYERKKRQRASDSSVHQIRAASDIGNPGFIASPKAEVVMTVTPDPREVFVVHGRDTAKVSFFFDLLRRIGLRPLEFESLIARSSSTSPYIGDIVRSGFDQAKACVILFTGDEIAQLRPELGADVQGFQPRPNVIFEAGMAMALQRERTIIVEVPPLRGLSDISGIHVIRFTSGIATERNNLVSRLRQAGCEIETTGNAWLELPFPS